MPSGPRKWSLAACIAALVLLAGALALTSRSASASTRGVSSNHAAKKQYTIYLSNNFLGNDWRVLMENIAKVLAVKAPLAGKMNLKIENTPANTASSQIQQLQEIISQRPDAIVVDASSPTALNGVVQQACSAGIKVISFDQVITAPCSYRIHVNTYQEVVNEAKWMARTLHGKGSLFGDIGVAGGPIAQLVGKAERSVFKHYPHIKVVCTFASQAALGPEETAVSNCLSAHPTVDGIISLGFGTGAMKVLKQAGHPIVPIVAASYNATMLACTNKKQPCFVATDPPWIGAYAVKYALGVLTGSVKSKPHEMYLDSPYYENNGVKVPGLKTEPFVIGKDAYPSLPGSVFLPISPSWATVTPKEAQTGKP